MMRLSAVRPYFPALLIFGVGVLARVGMGQPRLIDHFYETWPLIPLFLLFCVWAISVLAVGDWISRKMGLFQWLTIEKSAESQLFRLLCAGGVGTAVYAVGIEVLGWCGVLGPAWQPFYWLLMAMALVVGFPRGDRAARPKRGTFIESALFWIIIGVVALQVLQGFRLHQHGDPFYYHLVGPKLWFDRGAIRMEPHLFVVAQCLSWESLYLWPHQLFGEIGARGTAEVQYFAQWTHSFFGMGGTALALFLLLRSFSEKRLWVLLAVLAALFSKAMAVGSHLAKNDWGAAFWCFSGIVMLFVSFQSRSARERKAQELASGSLLGLAFAAKYTVIFTQTPLVILGAFFLRKRKAAVPNDSLFALAARVGAAFVFFASLYLIRNWIFTGNPIFPIPMSFTNSESFFGPTLLRGYRGYHVPDLATLFQNFHIRLHEILWDAPLNVLGAWGFLAGVLLCKRSISVRPSLLLGLAAFLTFLLFLSKVSIRGELRLLGPGTLLWAAASALILGEVLSIWKKPALALALAVLVLALGKVPLYTLIQVFPGKLKSATQNMREVHRAGEAKAWLRENASPSDRVILLYENEVYYMLTLSLFLTEYSRDFDQKVQETASSPEALLRLLATLNGRYVLDLDRAPFKPAMDLLARRDPSSVVFQSGTVRVFDARKLPR